MREVINPKAAAKSSLIVEGRGSRGEKDKQKAETGKQRSAKKKRRTKQTTVTESKKQNRHEKIHTRTGGTHRSITRECGAQNTALPARRKDEKCEGGEKITPDNPSSEYRKMLHGNNQM